jgi:signal transduction histidine kinase
LSIVTINSQKVILAANESFKNKYNALEGDVLPDSRLSEAAEAAILHREAISGLVIPEMALGKLTYYLVCSKISDEQGELRQTIILYDITQLYRHWESELEEGALQTIGEMAAGVADIILNPLAVINGTLQMIEQKMNELILLCPVTAHSIINSLSLAKHEADRINNHIRRLLHLGKPIEMLLKPELHSSVLSQIIPGIQQETLQRSFYFDCELPNRDVEVFIHLPYLKEVFNEITRNSYEAMTEGGRLRISVEIAGDEVVFKILDFGQGIPKEIKMQAKRPFFTTKDRSIGLGLSFCDVIMNKMGGKIHICSNINTGTEVTLSLPIIR